MVCLLLGVDNSNDVEVWTEAENEHSTESAALKKKADSIIM